MNRVAVFRIKYDKIQLFIIRWSFLEKRVNQGCRGPLIYNISQYIVYKVLTMSIYSGMIFHNEKHW
jgi:hypothetical protein